MGEQSRHRAGSNAHFWMRLPRRLFDEWGCSPQWVLDSWRVIPYPRSLSESVEVLTAVTWILLRPLLSSFYQRFFGLNSILFWVLAHTRSVSTPPV